MPELGDSCWNQTQVLERGEQFMLQKWLLGLYPGDNGRAGDQGVVGVTG